MSVNCKEGTYRTTPELAMAAFDKLPPVARKAFANAVANYAPQPWLTRYRRGEFKTGDEIAVWVRLYDLPQLEQWEEQRQLAIGAYKGNAPEKPTR